MVDIPPEEIVEYGVADSVNALALNRLLDVELEEWGLEKLYREVELPLIPVLGSMELRGISVDVGRAAQSFAEFSALADFHDFRAASELGDINLASGQQLSTALEEMEAPMMERTPTGRLVTDENALFKLQQSGWEPELMEWLMKGRQFRKLASFALSMIDLRLPDGKLHPDFNQCGSMEEAGDETSESPPGRLSSSNPNVQQIPHHGRGVKSGPEYEQHTAALRAALVASPGHVLIAADFAQQEPRICAYISGDEQLITDAESGRPIYAPTAAAIYGREISKRDDPSEWMLAKTYFLAYIYGAIWRKLIEIDPSFSETVARRAADSVDSRYKRLRVWHAEVIKFVRKHGYIRDYFGRVRLLPGALSADPQIRAGAYRQAINGLVQNVAATITKLLMLRVYTGLVLPGLAALIATIHDEIVLDVPVENVSAVLEFLKTASDGLFPMNLPLEVQIGDDLGHMEDV